MEPKSVLIKLRGKYTLFFFFIFFSSFFSHAQIAQSSQEVTSPLAQKIPEPGQLGSPFQTEHFWNRIGLELGAGYVPVVAKGAGYFKHGYSVTAGLVDHISPHWDALVEVQFFGLNGNAQSVSYSNTDFSASLGASYLLTPKRGISPYLIGSAGYYVLGSTPGCQNGSCALTTINTVNKPGWSGGVGIRHRLYAESRMEIFTEGRYHYIASGTTDYGQLSLFPVSAGIRW